jgi:sugar-specific transcriptional regulator TrmB
MINLEQVKLLETKVAKTIDFVEKVSKENTALLRREAELQEKLETYQKRIDELEVLIMGFKEEQGHIEDGILAALDRLSEFEEAIEKSLKEKPHGKSDGVAAGNNAAGSNAAGSRHTAKDTIKSPGHNLPQKKQSKEELIPQQGEEREGQAGFGDSNEKICFEIPDDETADDILDPLTETLDEDAGDGNSPAEGGELDIF